jgi:hypothetical protein
LQAILRGFITDVRVVERAHSVNVPAPNPDAPPASD